MQRVVALLLLIALSTSLHGEGLFLPARQDSVRFAVIGDSGTGGKEQYQVADQINEYHKKFPFEFTLMLGDNLYGRESSRAYEEKFERPYQALLNLGVKFYAALGNHDETNQIQYKLFNMHGERYYTFKPPNASVRFFALDSNYMDRRQLEWLEKELRGSGSDWKIAFFHHPLYSSGGTHGSSVELREVLEPLFLKYGVNVAFAGHDHIYERIKPQKGIYYFISGGAAKVRRGDIRKTELTEKGFDQDNHFMLVEISGDDFYFQTVSRSGATVDSSVIHRQTIDH